MTRTAASLLACLAATLGAGEAAPGPAVALGRAEVAEVRAGAHADLVVLSGGHAQGLRPGMVCAVARAGRAVARVVVAESRETRAVALVLAVAPGESILAGDLAEARAHPRI
jgi:cytosine/adenosine deaminase-related metal-dependent hydrolase